jgi:RNA polymerase sigma-70 factor (ECF subfamily)
VSAVGEGDRRHAFAVAYRMLGSVADADDAAQDAVLRLHREAPAPDHPRAWLTTVTTRLCLDRLRSARARREAYVGPWLPEPLLTAPDPAEDVARAEEVSLALLCALERLTPPERAAFVLHDAFGYGYDELAGVLDRSEAACRQLVSRARRAVRDERPRFDPDPERRAAVAQAFFAAAAGDDVAGLVAVLAEDCVLRADAGGERPAPRRVVEGAERVARVLVGIRDKGAAGPGVWTTDVVVANGTPALLIRDGGVPDTLLMVDSDGARVTAVHVLRNPAKLAAALGRGATPRAGRAASPPPPA